MSTAAHAPCRICGGTHPPGLGGSAMGRIFGLVPRTNALDVYHELTRPQDPAEREPETIHTIRGKAVEAMALDHFWARTGWTGWRMRDAITHPDYPAFRCHLDFVIAADAERQWDGQPAPEWMLGEGVGETKAPSVGVVQHILDHGLRESEMVQAYTYAAVSGRRWACFNFFTLEHTAGPVIVVPVLLPDELRQFLLAAGQRFWDQHVVPRVPPDPEEWRLMARRDMPTLPTLSGDRVVVTDAGVAELARATLEARDVAESADNLLRERKRELEAALLALGVKRVTVEGVGNFGIVQREGTTTFSADSLALARPLDWDKVRAYLLGRALCSAAEADSLLESMTLDLQRFERKGDPYQYLMLPRRPD